MKSSISTILGCVTKSGPSTGVPCVFPYIFEGITCPGPYCCNPSNAPLGAWCSTKVDDSGNHITGNYEYCNEEACQSQGTLFL